MPSHSPTAKERAQKKQKAAADKARYWKKKKEAEAKLRVAEEANERRREQGRKRQQRWRDKQKRLKLTTMSTPSPSPGVMSPPGLTARSSVARLQTRLDASSGLSAVEQLMMNARADRGSDTIVAVTEIRAEQEQAKLRGG